MCGISAIISFEESALVSNIFKMTDIVRHRGPDDEGFAVFGNNPSDIGIYGGDNTPENVYSCGLGFPPQTKTSIGSSWKNCFGTQETLHHRSFSTQSSADVV